MYGNQGKIYPTKGLFFENCGDTFDKDYNSKGLYISNLHGQTGANSSYYPIADEITGIGNHTGAYNLDKKTDEIIIKSVLTKGHVDIEDFPKNNGQDSLSRLLKSFRVGYRPPAHHALIVRIRKKIIKSNFLSKVESKNDYKKLLANTIRWIIKHRIDHYHMVVNYILEAPDPYKNQNKGSGTGGTPTPTFLPTMFVNSIDRLKILVQNENLPWAEQLIAITSNSETAMNEFKKIAMQQKD